MMETNPVLDSIRQDWDSFDDWGSCLEAHFQICYSLVRNGANVPDRWEFRLGLGGAEDADTPLAEELDLLMEQGHYSNLVHAGDVLLRYAEQLRLAGEDY